MKLTCIAIGLLFCIHNISALSVVPNPSTLACGMTSVTFTFDCSFTGTVFIPSSPNGVSYTDNTTASVTAGQLTFDVTVTSAATQNFLVNFVVLSSDMSACAPNNSSAAASLSHTCILPPNNDCAGAISLSISNNSCTSISYETLHSTDSGNSPNCAPPDYLDLYYTFNANNDTVTMEVPAVPGTVGFYALYDSCPNNGGNQLVCSIIIASQNMTFPLTGLTVGQDYYIQLLFLPGNAGIDQQICLHSTTVTMPPNNCMANITVSDIGPNFPNISYQSSQSISTAGITTVTTSGVVYDAGTEVILNPGFETGLNVVFEAKIGGCTP